MTIDEKPSDAVSNVSTGMDRTLPTVFGHRLEEDGLTVLAVRHVGADRRPAFPDHSKERI